MKDEVKLGQVNCNHRRCLTMTLTLLKYVVKGRPSSDILKSPPNRLPTRDKSQPNIITARLLPEHISCRAKG